MSKSTRRNEFDPSPVISRHARKTTAQGEEVLKNKLITQCAKYGNTSKKQKYNMYEGTRFAWSKVPEHPERQKDDEEQEDRVCVSEGDRQGLSVDLVSLLLSLL
jgi:hypothetical protein